MRRFATETFKESSYDLTVDHWGVLEILNEHEGLSLTELSRIMLKDLPTLTKIIDLVSKKGYVKRKTNIKDRRKFNLVLTKQGREVVVALQPIAEEIRSKIKKALTDEEVAILISILNKINSELDSQSDNQNRNH